MTANGMEREMSQLKAAVIFDGQSNAEVDQIEQALECPAVRSRFREASSFGVDLAGLFRTAPPEVLNSPAAHVLHFAVAVGLFDELRAREVVPSVVSGASLGQLSALTAAGVLRFERALEIVKRRSAIIASATRDFKGLTIQVRGSNPDLLERVTPFLTSRVSVAIINSSTSLNLTGPKEEVEEVETALKQLAGVKVFRLPFAVISHSPLLKAYESGMTLILAIRNRDAENAVFHSVQIPVISDLDGDLFSRFGGPFRKILKKQLSSTINWPAVVQRLRSFEPTYVVNVGLNPYLWRDTAKEWPEISVLKVSDMASVEAVVRALRS
ncbi:MAG: acyltransferase domain-containing protein [bacterium]|nr:acyltransferase domain-containing protein [bacterium]